MHVYSRGYPLPHCNYMTHLFYSWLKNIIVLLEIFTVESALDSDDEGIVIPRRSSMQLTDAQLHELRETVNSLDESIWDFTLHANSTLMREWTLNN